MPDWGPGGDADDVDSGDGSGGGPILPDWIPTSEPDWWSTAADWLDDPANHVRGIIFGTLLSGIAWFVEPVFDALQLVFAGSNPSEFGAEGEVWGIADLPVVLARLIGDMLSFPVDRVFDVMASVIEALTLRIPGPIDGIVINVTVAVIVIALARYGPLLVRSALEAIPVIGGPLSTLLGGAD